MRAIAWLLLLPIAACASDPMPEIVALYEAGDLTAAREKLLALEACETADAHLYRAERAIVELADAQPAAAVEALRAARDRCDELTGDGFFDSFASILLDDRQLAWPGADYERIVIRAILAAADLMAGGRDAVSYALQVLEKQRQIIDSYEREDGGRPKQDYRLVAFGSYLRGIMLEESPSARDEARFAFQKVAEIEPGWPYAAADLERITNGRHSDPGNGVLHVLGFVGLGPERVESEEPVSAIALTIAQAIWIHNRRTGGLPNLTEVPIPALSFRTDNPTSLAVAIDGSEVAHTATITDVNLCAQAEFDAIRPEIVARAVLRRAFKIGVTEGAKEFYGEQGRERSDEALAIDLAVSLIGMLWTGLESADLRCWHLMPAYLQAVRIEMPAGEYTVTLRAARDGHAVGAPQQVRVRVRDGFNTYVLGIAPTLAGGAPPMTSDPAAPIEGATAPKT